jgi:hypothetical protein
MKRCLIAVIYGAAGHAWNILLHLSSAATLSTLSPEGEIARLGFVP